MQPVMGGPPNYQPALSDVRILMVGEDGVGKTSLIMSLISEEFPDRTPPRMEEVTIPADVTPERVATHIVDYSKQDQSESVLHEELRKANVICIVYAANLPETITKLTTYWLPTIQEVLGTDHGKPVILVGNKSDEAETSNPNHMEQILPIMNQYSEIETCVECSAKKLKNISELFYYAQKAVLHPTHPLYIPEDKELTQLCKKALVRIFKICDQDNDGLLNDYELNQFQIRCFGVPLTSEAVQDVKAVVKKAVADGVLDDALTLNGFLFLHTLFIQRGRHETTWSVLRRFGYDNSLQLSKDYLYPPLKVPKGCSTEISYEGFQFLTALFEKFDEDKDGCLSPAELQNLFSVCATQPWNQDALNSAETNEQGWLTYNGYLSYWVLTTFLDVPRTLEYLAYLGFNARHANQLSAISIMRDRRIDIQEKHTSRSVFQCHVIGPKDVGKTAFVQSFVGRNLKQVAALNRRQLTPYTINSVQVQDQQKYLLLHEVDVFSPDDPLTLYEKSADVICLIYDVSNPSSFEYCAQIFKKYFNRMKVPCLIVATKTERREVVQQYELQPAEFCQKHRLPMPVRFHNSDLGRPTAEVYTKLATMAVYPCARLLSLRAWSSVAFSHLKQVYFLHDSSIWTKVTLGAAVAALIGFLVFKNV